MNIKSGKNCAFERCFQNLALLRYYLYKKEYNEALSLSTIMCKELESEGVVEVLSEVELLKAKILLKKNKSNEAIDSVIRAIQYTQNEESIRTFIVEGDEIFELLKEIKEIRKTKSSALLDSISKDFLYKLIEAFEKEKRMQKFSSEEALSGRELETLKLIAEDLSNQEIADELFISITTVKTHVRNILSKLDAKNRREAVLISKEKGVL